LERHPLGNIFGARKNGAEGGFGTVKRMKAKKVVEALTERGWSVKSLIAKMCLSC